MVNVVVLSHGRLASALIEAVEMIAGHQEGLFAVEIDPGDAPESFVSELEQLLEMTEPQPVLLLVDLLGGTPYNVAARGVRSQRCEVVTGVNLPILLESVMSRGTSQVSELALSLERAGRESVRSLGPQLRELASADGR